ncbi:hypothetical protein PF005_g17247 [Phytophthora fragariae]|uniref:Uncharacterized protein n=1 Tax=Phytophthora fragariae TaxID=53985 RepID=A0A6A3X347_9STRA|nr:hypothetical protein PF005_g17247 [Phytophthora fragariae]KAE9279185.1 hypothetical protein PF001_g24830 [Phytophthora fragariae]
MCMKIECPTCHKATWRGCGNHIDTAVNGASSVFSLLTREGRHILNFNVGAGFAFAAGVKEEDRCPHWQTGKH